MHRLTIILFLLTIYCYADYFSFKEIEAMPKSISKDYYTWRFLQEKNTTKDEALKAYEWTKRKNHKLKKAIRKKIGYIPKENKTETPKDPNNYIIYPSTASKKSKKTLKRLYKKIKKQGKYSDVLKVMTESNPFEALKSVTPKTAIYIFNGCSKKYRKKHLNHPFSKEQLQELATEEQFNKSISKIVTTHSLENLKKSLIYTPPTDTLSFKSLFLLAINAVEFSEIEIAKAYLNIAKSRTKYQSQKDQSNFWLYLLTQDKSYLKSLIESSQINIYTLSARDILEKPYPKVITPNLGFHLVADIDPYSPIDWEKIKIAIKKEPNKIDELAEKYNSYQTEGIYTYLKEKATEYKKPYYPMPYRDAMIGINRYRVALLYALGRQESRFVPASISTSYALGMMQIMPFLIKHLAKERGESLDLNEMFNPYIAISYANQHLDYLTTYLYHPLFIAYGYNGGIGFTKRTIKSSHLFKTGKYEPYLSMELIDYEESKEYGKKVLANYIIYLNILGVKTRLAPFLEILDEPLETDKFR
jgi:soluble lytic murein transglycosylase